MNYIGLFQLIGSESTNFELVSSQRMGSYSTNFIPVTPGFVYIYEPPQVKINVQILLVVVLRMYANIRSPRGTKFVLYMTTEGEVTFIMYWDTKNKFCLTLCRFVSECWSHLEAEIFQFKHRCTLSNLMLLKGKSSYNLPFCVVKRASRIKIKMTVMQVYRDWATSHMTVVWQGQRSVLRNQAILIDQNTTYNSLTHFKTCVIVKEAVSY